MSTDDSIGTYDSLFDDDTITLRTADHDLENAQGNEIAQEPTHDPPPWCMSSSCSRSCCSLCRPPAIFEAEDDSNACRPAGVSAFRCSSNDAQATHPSATLTKGVVGWRALPSISLCDGNCVDSSSCLNACRSLYRVPIKSIEIPRCCIDPSTSTEGCQEAVSVDGIDYLSTSFLPDDALSHIINFLSAASLTRLRECNRKLRHAASLDSAGWQNHALGLWSGKVTVCRTARELLAESRRPAKETPSTRAYMAMEAYKKSIVDATRRQEITPEELCFDSAPNVSGITTLDHSFSKSLLNAFVLSYRVLRQRLRYPLVFSLQGERWP